MEKVIRKVFSSEEYQEYKDDPIWVGAGKKLSARLEGEV